MGRERDAWILGRNALLLGFCQFLVSFTKRILAFHEGGHALVAYHVPEADTVNCVTILARGQSLGVTQFTAKEDRYNYSRETLMARIAVGLGGRVAEERTFGPKGVTTGAENDLRVVTDLAYRMVTRWGMSQQVGVIYAESRNEASGVGLNMRRLESEDIPGKVRALISDADGHLVIDGDDQHARQQAYAMMVPGANQVSSATLGAVVNSEVQRILRAGYEMARHLVSEHDDQLTALADALLAHEQIDRTQFEGFLQKEGWT